MLTSTSYYQEQLAVIIELEEIQRRVESGDREGNAEGDSFGGDGNLENNTGEQPNEERATQFCVQNDVEISETTGYYQTDRNGTTRRRS